MNSIEWLMQTLEQNNIIDLDIIDSDKYYTIIDQAKEMEKQQTEISDEEIKKWAKEYTCKEYDRLIFDYENYDTYDDFINGAKKYREQLKKKQ